MSVSEKVLWNFLRNDNLGFRFRRQYAIGPYVLDFYCPEAKLCIEVDGEQHQLTKVRDTVRDQYLLDLEIATLRIPSLDFFQEDAPGAVGWIERISELCVERTGRQPEFG